MLSSPFSSPSLPFPLFFPPLGLMFAMQALSTELHSLINFFLAFLAFGFESVELISGF